MHQLLSGGKEGCQELPHCRFHLLELPIRLSCEMSLACSWVERSCSCSRSDMCSSKIRRPEFLTCFSNSLHDHSWDCAYLGLHFLTCGGDWLWFSCLKCWGGWVRQREWGAWNIEAGSQGRQSIWSIQGTKGKKNPCRGSLSPVDETSGGLTVFFSLNHPWVGIWAMGDHPYRPST